jgi:hypothetical protein
LTYRLSAAALATLLIGGGQLLAQAERKPPKETISFGTLRSATPEAARSQAEAWLKGVGKTDEATRNELERIWKDEGRTVLDRVAATLTLGDPAVKEILQQARDEKASAPTDIPAQLKDAKLAGFYRANLALAYAKALSNRRVFEEALEALRAVKVEDSVDPAAFLFTKAVSEYSLMDRKSADDSIVRLLDDVGDSPDRYKMLAALMHYDMLAWKDKDLGWIARKMDNIERRLGHARGGPITQKMEKEVVMRLDELIKEKENQKKGNGNGGC